MTVLPEAEDLTFIRLDKTPERDGLTDRQLDLPWAMRTRCKNSERSKNPLSILALKVNVKFLRLLGLFCRKTVVHYPVKLHQNQITIFQAMGNLVIQKNNNPRS